jgi:hypothetical protein
MSKTALKRTQIKGKKYDLPQEDVTLEKLIRKGLNLTDKLSSIKDQLERVKEQITKIAKRRREGNTTVNLKAVSGLSIVTFRESYVCDDGVEEIQHDLGSLYDRFFTKKTSFQTTKELKGFLEGEHVHGLDDPEPIKILILSHVKMKETKPNVKIVPVDV